MQIGIITFHCADNYGAVLQCYALKKYIEKMGENVEIINYAPYHLTSRYNIFPTFKEVLGKIKNKGIIYTWKNIIFVCIKTFLKRLNKKKKFKEFRFFYIGIKSKKIKKITNRNCPDYDMYIAGSDQIWNPTSNRGDTTYYLDFVDDKSKKVSYAASIGTFDIDEYKSVMAKYLQRFDFISIREELFRDLIENISHKKVSVVLDPVFLLDLKDWDKLTGKIRRFSEKFIFMYLFNKDNDAIKLANKLSRKYNLPIVHFYYGTLRKKLEKDGKCFFFDGPLDFLWYIKHAEYIITNSFHCVAFSLIFKKEFYSYFFTDRGSRIVDILKKLNLEERICTGKEIDNIIEYTNKINYDTIDNILLDLKQESYNYINKIIRGDKNS